MIVLMKAHDHLRIITTRQHSGEGEVSSRVCPQGWGGSHVTTTHPTTYPQWWIQDFCEGLCQLTKFLLFLKFFAENSMKMKECGPRGRASLAPPWICQCSNPTDMLKVVQLAPYCTGFTLALAPADSFCKRTPPPPPCSCSLCSLYCRQADGRHPTGTLSCSLIKPEVNREFLGRECEIRGGGGRGHQSIMLFIIGFNFTFLPGFNLFGSNRFIPI